ncbi:hypothetical protein E2C01_040188 [Portunus trituberculatus]|uniref:Uncharacterized protein n=1 Tax=Portunus trituberculatus TaxID=210409 RepID=A0A5B7FNA9_PORTR|nr:hypothetical protein [Portunus trituberculatus]
MYKYTEDEAGAERTLTPYHTPSASLLKPRKTEPHVLPVGLCEGLLRRQGSRAGVGGGDSNWPFVSGIIPEVTSLELGSNLRQP